MSVSYRIPRQATLKDAETHVNGALKHLCDSCQTCAEMTDVHTKGACLLAKMLRCLHLKPCHNWPTAQAEEPKHATLMAAAVTQLAQGNCSYLESVPQLL